MKKSNLVIVGLMAMGLAGCGRQSAANQVLAQVKTTQKQIDQFSDDVNKLSSDKKMTETSFTSEKKKIQPTYTKLKNKMYLSGLTADDHEKFNSAQTKLKKLDEKYEPTKETSSTQTAAKTSSASSSSTKQATQKDHVYTTKKYFQKNGIVNANTTLTELNKIKNDKSGAYKEAKRQATAIQAVSALYTNANFNAVNYNSTVNDVTYARSLVQQSSTPAFRTKYGQLIDSASYTLGYGV